MGESRRTFQNPYDVPTPVGAEGWETMYPQYLLFAEDERERDEQKLWFFDQMHNPEPLYPFDLMMPESWLVSLNQYTTRIWQLPTALGIEHRIVNGYLYLSPNVIDDQDEMAAREPVFAERARHYFENWDEIYDHWVTKATDCIERLKAMRFEPLAEREPETTVFAHRGTSSAFDLLVGYSRFLENMHEMAYYHFELLNLAYGAYLTFLEFCKTHFPAITDDLVARMVAGIEVILYRPDAELRRLAARAVQLGVGGAFAGGASDPDQVIQALSATAAGKEWLEELEAVKDPWFYYSTGSGYCHATRAWIDDLRPPFAAISDYVTRIGDGESLERPLEHLRAERERLASGYRQLLDDDDAVAFDNLLALSRQVFPFVENHNFYVEHWHHSIFFDKARELGAVLVAGGVLDQDDDIFFLHRYEVYQVLYEVEARWSLGVPTRSERIWRDEVARRRRIHKALEAWSPPPALGVPPEAVTEPITVTLFGINSETVERWLAAEGGTAGSELKGLAASPGLAEGYVRVCHSVDELADLVDGEILVCPLTAPSWSIVFARIAAAVSDGGGIMSHAAIVSREYELPAVVATGVATQTLSTGDLIRVDGDAGVVTILQRAGAA